MQSFSQNKEDLIIAKYFKKKGNFLSIGENNGVTFSNVRLLALTGFSGLVVEPSPEPFKQLLELYRTNPTIACLNAAIGLKSGKAKFYDSGTHLNNGDTSLLSTLNQKDYDKWKDTTDFKEIEVDVITVEEMLKLSPYNKFQFISIDAEGLDFEILQQLDLTKLDCRCICIEHNGEKALLKEIKRYCGFHGLTNELLLNGENIILAL